MTPPAGTPVRVWWPGWPPMVRWSDGRTDASGALVCVGRWGDPTDRGVPFRWWECIQITTL